MENLKYSIRLESFRRPRVLDATFKWPSPGPAMTSMARCFFVFSPTEDLPDRAICVKCGLEITEWSNYKASPFIKHADLNTHCFVSTLGTIAANSYEKELFSPELLYETCLKSYQYCDIDIKASQDLSRLGFYCMSQIGSQLETVGCLGCIPRGRLKQPVHNRGCPIWKLLRESAKRKPVSIIPSPQRPLSSCGSNAVSVVQSPRPKAIEYPPLSSGRQYQFVFESPSKAQQSQQPQQQQQHHHHEQQHEENHEEQNHEEHEHEEQEHEEQQLQQQQEVKQQPVRDEKQEQEQDQDQNQQLGENEGLNNLELDEILKQLITEEEQPSLSVQKSE